MGRYYGYGYKTESDGLLWIDTVALRKMRYLEEGSKAGNLVWTDNWGKKSSVGIWVEVSITDGRMTLNYTGTDRLSDEKTQYNYDVPLVSTECNFGGRRFWFICPLTKRGKKCHKRIRKLYCHNGYFGCRDCLDLCYSEQNENPNYRYGIFRYATLERRVMEIENSIKRPYYAGNPTRKQKQLYKLYSSLSEEYDKIDLGKLL